MRTHVLHCPSCHGTAMVRQGTTSAGQQRSRCRTCRLGRGRTFLLASTSAGQAPEVTQQLVERAMHARGMRDTARVLPVSPPTVRQERKKRPLRSHRCRRRSCRTCPQSRERSRAGAPRSLPPPRADLSTRCEVELWRQERRAAVALACDGSRQRDRVSVWRWTAKSGGVSSAASPVRTVEPHALFHRWVGGLCAASRCRAAPRGQSPYAEARKQAQQCAHPDQAARASHTLLLHNNDDA